MMNPNDIRLYVIVLPSLLVPWLTGLDLGRRTSSSNKRKRKRRKPRLCVECMWQDPLMKLGSLACSCTLPYHRTQVASSLFLQHNTALVPPYRVLIDTNFINFSLQNKLELVSGMMDCLFAKCMSPRFTLDSILCSVSVNKISSQRHFPVYFVFLGTRRRYN
jgi:hypothetical protein